MNCPIHCRPGYSPWQGVSSWSLFLSQHLKWVLEGYVLLGGYVVFLQAEIMQFQEPGIFARPVVWPDISPKHNRCPINVVPVEGKLHGSQWPGVKTPLWVLPTIPCKTKNSLGSMHDTGCLGLVHWEDPEGWYGEGGGRREEGSGWGTHVYLWQINLDIWQN